MFQKETISLGDWLIYQVLMAIPLVNIIFFFYILANPKTNKSMQNFLLSGLIWTGVSLAIFFFTVGPLLGQFLALLPDILNQLSSLQ